MGKASRRKKERYADAPRRPVRRKGTAAPPWTGELLTRGVFPALAVLLAAAATLRGLFFRPDQLTIGLVVFALGAGALLAVRAYREDGATLSLLDVFAGGFTLVSWLSVLWAVEQRIALQEALVASTGLLLYAFVRSATNRRAVVAALYGALSLIGVVSFVMAGGAWNFPSAVLGDRLCGPFQYPDTAGAVFLGGWLMGLAGRRRIESRLWRDVVAALAGLFAFLFALTLSRGAMLALPVALLVAILSARKGDRIALTVEGIVVGLAAFLLGTRTNPHFNNVGNPHAFLYGLLAAAVAVVVAEALDYAHQRGYDRWQTALVAVLAVLVLGGAYIEHRAGHGVIVAGTAPVTIGLTLPPGKDTLSVTASGSGTGSLQVESGDRFGTLTTLATLPFRSGTTTSEVTVPTTSRGIRLVATAPKGDLAVTGVAFDHRPLSIFWAKALPQSLYHRLLGFSSTDLSVWERIDFWKDGLKMFAARPLFGWGGGAWAVIYRGFQSFNYSSNEAHSSLVDAMVSYGTLGLLLEALLAAAIVAAVVKGFGRGDFATAALVGGVAIWTHSLIDFDLSLASVLFLLWGLLAAGPQVPWLRLRLPTGLTLRALGIASAALAVWSVFLLTAAETTAAAKPSIASLQQAVQTDPMSASAHYELAIAEVPHGNLLGLTKPQALYPVLTQLQEAYQLDPWSEQYATAYAQALLNAGQGPTALKVLEAAERDGRMDPVAYANVASIAATLGQNALQSHLRPAAEGYFRTAAEAYSRYLATYHETLQDAPANLQIPPPSGTLLYYAGEADALLGRAGAAALLHAAVAGGVQAADDWLGALGQVKLPPTQYAYQKELLALAHPHP